MNFNRIVLVTKRTPYEELLLRHSTHGNAAFLLQSRGEDIKSYQIDHEKYYQALRQVEASLPKDVTHTLTERSYLPRYLFRPNDLVIAVGPDGLFANLAKYLNGQPVIAVNPNRAKIDGAVMRFDATSVSDAVRMTMEGNAKFDEVTLAEATNGEGGRLLAVNDFLVGRLDHISARYSISYRGELESQSSSGVLISTGMGASGWMSSIRKGVAAGSDGEDLMPKIPTWDERRLTFAVREPFPSRTTGTSIVYGDVLDETSLEIKSEMPEGGVIFSDGVPEDCLRLPAGTSLKIKVAPEGAILVRPWSHG